MDSIHSRYSSIRSFLPKGVRIVAVTKGRTTQQIQSVVEAGALDIGENKVSEAAEKFPTLLISSRVVRHMVGHLQRNKVKEAVSLFDVIQSVDSLALAQKIAKEAEAQKKRITVYVEFNVSGKEERSGFSTEKELLEAVEKIRALQSPFFKLDGLMGIATVEHPVRDFKKLKKLSAQLKLPVLSMGMSGDYELAVYEGATMIRIGRALFPEE
ncbi:MAG: YggS family pyridoxal phosphate-dependent enzyme [Candidatus Micrarchaeota archaeon]|nr:YggS family pyridoxal phosphate-dependent enzyme [Candidatus Micrarchaeota archaeon]